MSEKRRVYGPPGTGKTTRLTAGVRDEVAARGADNVIVGSFSNTAAEVLGGRDTGLSASQIGTLHSFAYRAIGHSRVALDPKVITEWNEGERPEWAIHPEGRHQGPPVEQDTDDENVPVNAVGTDVANARTGDQLITALDLLRSTMVPEADWPPNVVEFANRWEPWKRENGAVDYSDMILNALEAARDGERAPGSPEVLVFDEAQDMTPSEVALVLAWGRHAERVVFGLDDDQAIAAWRGGLPETIIGLGTDPDMSPDHPLYVDPDELFDTVLDQSFRVPAAAHGVAEAWIRKLSMRRDKAYRPRRADAERFGEDAADGGMGTAQVVKESLQDAALIDRVEAHNAAGRSVMVLASCNYQLLPVIKELRRRGIPFHNPYRPTESRWNPLGRTAGISTPERLWRYLVMDERELGERSRLWTGEDVAAWVELLDSKGAGLAHGAKQAAKRLGSGTADAEDVAALFAEFETFELAAGPDLAWFERSLLPSKARAAPMTYALQVARNHGPAALVETPQVILGTTHCSPADEPVLTTEGYVPIGQLDPTRHRLASYDAGCNRPSWNMGYRAREGQSRGVARDVRRGYDFRVARNPYSGPMLTLSTARSATRVTPDHRVRVQWSDDFAGKWAVYLMRRGGWWRVGICTTAHRPYRSGGVSGRLSTEQGDAAWLLDVCETRREALITEAQIQAQYGIPGLTFEASEQRSLTTADLHAVHEAVAGQVAPRAKELLADHGLDDADPLFVRTGTGKAPTNMSRAFVINARNVVSRFMLLPALDESFAPGDKPTWLPVTVEAEPFEGDVYSLDVLPHRYYVSGGAIVHNSAKGGEADVVMVAPDLSTAAARQLARPGGKDSVIRLQYVAMTRGLRHLEVLSPSSRSYVKLRDLLPRELEVTP